MSMELKNRIKLGMGLLLVIAVGLAVYFGFFAAKAPAEIPDLAERTGTVTVTLAMPCWMPGWTSGFCQADRTAGPCPVLPQ